MPGIDALELKKVYDQGLYKKMGFKSIAEYAQDTYSIKRTYTYNLLRHAKLIETLASDSDINVMPLEKQGKYLTDSPSESNTDCIPQFL